MINKRLNTTPEEINESQNNLISEWNMTDEHNEKIFTKIVGLQLKKIRLAKGLTQTKVSKKINVTFQQVQKYERGQNELRLINIKKLAEVFDVEESYFYKPIIDRDLRFIIKKRGINVYPFESENLAR
jgi:DNA-binding transcriptional regulator YiaG|tara:strand:+ start:281 stop:664 length:384 start_codon:yes stop_codon:yes gene_type:complete